MAALVGAALFVSAPTFAASANGDQNLFALYQQVQQLQEQVRTLNGEIDTLKHRVEQNQKHQMSRNEGFDSRLSKLEGGSQPGGAGSTGTSGATSLDLDGESSAGSSATTGTTSGANTEGGNSSDYGSEVLGPDSSSGSNAQSSINASYENAFNQLQNQKYDKAISSFKKFVAQYPDTDLTDNAWYWLGEAYYVQGNLGASEQAFQTVVNKFKQSRKVPGALYKIALIEAAGGHTDNAKATLQGLIGQYPSSGVAEEAKKKLKSM